MAADVSTEFHEVPVLVNGKSSKIIVLQDEVVIERNTKKGKKEVSNIPASNILNIQHSEANVKRNTDVKKYGKVNGVQIDSPVSFTIYSAIITQKWKWRVAHHEIICSSTAQCKRLMTSVNAILNQAGIHRPKNLFVIINPSGGRRKGERLYHRHVAPIFDLASVVTHITVTERAEDARNLLLEHDLSSYDGIISVGGDGTFAEIVNALILKAQYANGLDPDDLNTALISPSIPIGIIPAGSTDVVVYGTTGVNDPTTSALQIILGHSLGLDVCSVHHSNYLLRYTVSFLGYGFFGDVVRESENFRWMGPKRYDFAGMLKFIRSRSYYGEVSFLPSSDENHSPWDTTACRAGCNICKEKERKKDTFSEDDLIGETEDGKQDWQHVKGTFKAVNAAVISGICAKAPKGISPAGHLGNGCVDLMLVHKCSRFSYLHLLLRMASKANHFNFDFVDVHRVKAFHFQTLPTESSTSNNGNHSSNNDYGKPPTRQPSVSSTSSWNLDGEIGDQPDIDVRVHCQLIKVFARGPEGP